MEKLKVISTYARYINNLDTATDVVECYEKMKQYLNKNCFHTVLWRVLLFATINETIKLLKQKNFNFKASSDEWDSDGLSTFFQLLKLTKKYWVTQQEDSFIINQAKLLKLLLENLHSTYTELYCWGIFKQDLAMKLFVEDSKKAKELLNASTEEEVEVILNEANNSSTAAQEETRFKDVPNIPPKHLFELFNPKTVDECDADLERLEKMVIDGNINKSQYGVIKDILILPRRHRYSNGEVYTEPKNVDLKLKIHDATLEESLVLS